MPNLSCENEFYLHENEKWCPYQRLSTYPRFETEVRGNSEMAYYLEGYVLKPCHDVCTLRGRTSRCHGSKISGSHQTVVLQIWQKKWKNWHVWLSYAWMHPKAKRWPILFFNPSTTQNAVSVKKYCWDPECCSMVTWRHTCPLYNHPSYVVELLL